MERTGAHDCSCYDLAHHYVNHLGSHGRGPLTTHAWGGAEGGERTVALHLASGGEGQMIGVRC